MLERLEKRAAERGSARAAARRERLAADVAAAAPAGVDVQVEGERVVLSGRGLARRFLVDPALRWLVAEARHGR